MMILDGLQNPLEDDSSLDDGVNRSPMLPGLFLNLSQLFPSRLVGSRGIRNPFWKRIAHRIDHMDNDQHRLVPQSDCLGIAKRR